MFSYIMRKINDFFCSTSVPEMAEPKTFRLTLNDGSYHSDIDYIDDTPRLTTSSGALPRLNSMITNNAIEISDLFNRARTGNQLGNAKSNDVIAQELISVFYEIDENIEHALRFLVYKAIQNGQYGDNSIDWLEWLLDIGAPIDHHIIHGDDLESLSSPFELEYPRRPVAIMAVGTRWNEGASLTSFIGVENPQRVISVLKSSAGFDIDARDPENGLSALAHMIYGYNLDVNRQKKDDFNKRANILLSEGADAIFAIRTLLAFSGNPKDISSIRYMSNEKFRWPPCLDAHLAKNNLDSNTLHVVEQNQEDLPPARRL